MGLRDFIERSETANQIMRTTKRIMLQTIIGREEDFGVTDVGRQRRKYWRDHVERMDNERVTKHVHADQTLNEHKGDRLNDRWTVARSPPRTIYKMNSCDNRRKSLFEKEENNNLFFYLKPSPPCLCN